MVKVHKSVGIGRVQRERCNNDDDKNDKENKTIRAEQMCLDGKSRLKGAFLTVEPLENNCHRGGVKSSPRWKISTTAVAE